MIDSPLVSVITPFLNSEKYIAEMIKSVLSQTCADWELLLINDGSNDQSSVIAREFASRFPEKIFYLEHHNHQNLGKSTSRNIGITNSKGKYLCFLDSDDIFLPHKLEYQVKVLEENPEASSVFGVTEYWYSWNKNSRKKDFVPELGLTPDRIFEPQTLGVFFLANSHFTPCLCSFLVRKHVINRIGGFPENIQDLFEDQVLLYKIFLTEHVFAENVCNERYRQHSESSSAIAIQNKSYHPVLPNRSRLIFLEWLETYIRENNIENPLLEKVLQRELRIFEHPSFYSLYLPAKNIFRKVKNRLLN